MVKTSTNKMLTQVLCAVFSRAATLLAAPPAIADTAPTATRKSVYIIRFSDPGALDYHGGNRTLKAAAPCQNRASSAM